METRVFSIFKVHAYKSGELSSSINLDKNKFIKEIIENFYNDVRDDFNNDDISEEELLQYIKDYELKWLDYPSDDEPGFCGEFYEHINGTLIDIGLDDFAEDIAKYLIELKKGK